MRTEMDGHLELVIAIAGTGVSLAALNITLTSGVRHEIADVRNEISKLRERLARVEATLDVFRLACNCRGHR